MDNDIRYFSQEKYRTIHMVKWCWHIFFLFFIQFVEKVWHTGLLYKLKRVLPHPEYNLLKSYPCKKTLLVRYQQAHTRRPETVEIMTATYADDTADNYPPDPSKTIDITLKNGFNAGE